MHDLDITDDIASFADSRSDAWHQLGQSVGHLMTAEEVMAEAHLGGWNVRKMPMVIPQPPLITPDGVTTARPVPVDGKFATVRTNPITGAPDYLGVVGNSYRPFQNEESCELLDILVSESGAHFETAGALRGGRETFVTMKLPDTIELRGHDGEIDITELYLAALNSHDGGSAFRFLISPVRVVCANTQDAAVAQAQASFAVWHTGKMTGTIAEARQALGLAFRYVEEFERECARLFEREMTVPEATQFAETLVGMSEATTELQRANRHKHSNNIVKLFVSSPTVAAFAGTRLGAYNAVTEYVDHHMDVRGGKGANATMLQDMRALRTLTSSAAHDLKLEAFRLLTN